MPIDDFKFERVADNDPRRCQSTHSSQQCPYKAVEGRNYCPRHLGSDQGEKRESVKKYITAKWQDRIGSQADHPEIKNLNEEVGILRMTLEAKLNQCNDENMLLMYSSTLTTLVREIRDTVSHLHKIQMQTNSVLDRTQALDFVYKLGEIIFKEIGDLPGAPEMLKRISDAMIEDLNRRTNYGVRETKVT
jgi:hypothetical protein